MNCELIAVGTELLLGSISNTNGQFLSKELANIGINVFRHSVVGDNKERVKKTIADSFERCDLIITTGGLGPTKDDLTKEAIAEYFNRPLKISLEQKFILERKFGTMNYTLSENNYRQVYFPAGAIILPNNNGTAPGVLISENGKTLIMLPGPPHECKKMFNESVLPYLKEQSGYKFVSKNLNFLGIGESLLEEKLMKLINSQENPTIAPYAKNGYVSIRVTAKCKSEDEAEKLIAPIIEQIFDIAGEYIYAMGDVTPEEGVVNKLIEKNMTIGISESCTGGMLASYIVNVDGASKVLNEAIVTYSDNAKEKYLDVAPETIKEYGAVSKEVAKEMAEGIKLASGSDIGIGITGISGPNGGSEKKPVGLVYIGIAIGNKANVYKYNYNRSRNENRLRAVYTALHLILTHIK